jgi:hypothetical protein
MRSLSSLIAAVLVLAPTVGSASSGGDPCKESPQDDPSARVTLVNSTLNEHGVFHGTFKIENISQKQTLTIRGSLHKEDGVLRVDRPDISIEYLDLTNRWQRMIEIPGSYYAPKSRLSIQPGKSKLVSAPLVSAELATLNGREFRLLLRLRDSSQCLVSTPFRGLPPRPRVNQLESSGRSSKD